MKNFLSGLLLLMAFVAAGCADEAADVPFSRYDVQMSQRDLTEAMKNKALAGVCVVRSATEFENLLPGATLPAVDFATRSLLLVAGIHPNGVDHVRVELFEGTVGYLLRIEAVDALQQSPTPWIVAIGVDPLVAAAPIELQVADPLDS